MKEPAQQKIVALDIGGVCVSILVNNVLRKRTSAVDEKILQDVFSVEHHLECGEVTTSEWADSLRKYFQIDDISRDEALKIFRSVIGTPLSGVCDAVRRAAARGYRFIFLSNTSSIHMEEFLSKFELPSLVSGAVFSYAAGSMKPDPGIYEAFEKQYGKPCLYFDDNRNNIRAAMERGWNAVLFDSFTQLDELCI